MSAMSDPSASVTAWPAARPAGISPIQHPAWEAARNAILDLAAEGPVTALIVGESGTGKSWLLRELASALGGYGFPTTLLMQGNLPMSLSSGAALLVDDASLMDQPIRAQLSDQQHGVVVLTGAEWFEDELDPASPSPVVIRLRTLEPGEIADFAAEWLQRSGMPDSIVGPGMLSRLTSGSGGRVGKIVQLLGESAMGWQSSPILAGGETRPELIADLVPEPPATEPIAPPLAPAAPPRRRVYPLLLGGSAIAAAIALGWALMPVPPRVRIAQSVVADAPLTLPPLKHADTSGPALATLVVPAQSDPPAPPLAVPPLPELDATTKPEAQAAVVASPTIVATLDDPASAEPLPSSRRSNLAASPGLVLIAQRGDTLESLYGNVYRDRNAPPFAIVAAANPGPFKPGAIVVFPEPPGGWQRVQR